ncbi:MAG: hypothetical protein ACRBDL_05125 [Alphaproteobacteria bacterium]
MAKSFNKSGHSSSYTRSASIWRRRGSVRGNNVPIRDNITLQQTTIRQQVEAQQQETKKQPDPPPKIEVSSVTYDRGLTPWHHIESDNSGFIALQALSAIGLAGVGLTGDFAPAEKNALVQTGAGNATRNIGWFVLTCGFNADEGLQSKLLNSKAANKYPETAKVLAKAIPSINPLSKSLGKIATYHSFKTSKAMKATAKLMKPTNSKWDLEVLKGTRKWILDQSKTIERSSMSRRDRINNYTNNPIGREIFESPINAAFLALGTGVHIFQGKMGWDMYQHSGDLNGHLIGATVAGAAYGLMAAHHMKMMPRLREAYNNHKENPEYTWNDKARHQELGYIARGQYAQDALFTWAPPILLMAKGGAYMYEMTHIHHWSLPEKSLEESIAAIPPETFESLSGFYNAMVTTDYSNVATAGASLLMLGVGAVFTKSAWDEFEEHNGKKVRYIADNYINAPISKPTRYVTDKLEKTLTAHTPDWIQDGWFSKIKPGLGYVLPSVWFYDKEDLAKNPKKKSSASQAEDEKPKPKPKDVKETVVESMLPTAQKMEITEEDFRNGEYAHLREDDDPTDDLDDDDITPEEKRNRYETDPPEVL